MAASNTEPSAAVIVHSPRSPLAVSRATSDHHQKPNPNSSGNASPKKAWKQRSTTNDAPVPVVAIEPGPVIGGPESWPALSESASKLVMKPSPKASDASSSSPSPPPTHQSQSVSSPSKSSSRNPNLSPGPSRASQPRPKPTGRNNALDLANGGSGAMHSPFPVTGSPAGSPHSSPVSEANWGGDSSNNVSGNSFTRSNNAPGSHNTHYRRGGFTGNRWRGNGGGAHNNGGRRNQEYFDGQHRGQPRGFRPQYIRNPPPPIALAPPPPPYAATSPQSHPPYVGNMPLSDMPGQMYFYPILPPPEVMRSMQLVGHPVTSPSAFMFPQLDPQSSTLLRQINYYFSFDNLCKDTFLRKNMDAQGWVPISLIAGFNKVKEITNDVQFILETLRCSTVIEVQGDKIRKRDDWQVWLLPPDQEPTDNASSRDPSPGPPQLTIHSLTPHLQRLDLEGTLNNSNLPLQHETGFPRLTSGDLTQHVQLTGLHVSAGSGHVMGPVDLGRVLLRSDTF